MKRKITGTMVGLLSILILLLFDSTETKAASIVSSQLLDNDNVTINSSQNEYDGTWNYQSYSGDYNGDHRLAGTASTYLNTYVWRFTQRTGTRYIYAYLNNPNFTDPSAYYMVWQGTINGGTGYVIRSFNQNTAPGGWNLI